MFEAMGLGRSEDRLRLADFSGAPARERDAAEDTQEQLFIRLENSTFQSDEAWNG